MKNETFEKIGIAGIFLIVGCVIGVFAMHIIISSGDIEVEIEPIQLERNIIFAREGDTLFDMNKSKFIQLRDIDYFNTTALCGGFTNFYNDANTTIQSQYLSFVYVVDNCIAIGSIDVFPYAEYVESVGGWKVKSWEA